MKKIILLLVGLLVLSSCIGKDDAPDEVTGESTQNIEST
jgi:PBP1b-binding outer membrane lipoprotein LpoB